MNINQDYKKDSRPDMELAFQTWLDDYPSTMIDEEGLRNLFFAGAYSYLAIQRQAHKKNDEKWATKIFRSVMEWALIQFPGKNELE